MERTERSCTRGSEALAPVSLTNTLSTVQGAWNDSKHARMASRRSGLASRMSSFMRRSNSSAEFALVV